MYPILAVWILSLVFSAILCFVLPALERTPRRQTVRQRQPESVPMGRSVVTH